MGNDMGYAKSRQLLQQAEKLLAGGIGSNFRRKEKPFPLYFSHGEGPYVWDVDGNRYIDFVLGQGPLLLGHCHPKWIEAMTEQLKQGQLYAGQSELEITLSKKIQQTIPGADRIRYGNSSSEIVQLALRIARSYTGRNRWIKMEGHYHGWLDNVLVSVHPDQLQVGSLEQPNVILHSAGQDPKIAQDVLVSHFNNSRHLEKLFKENPDQIAAVMMEPAMCNSGCCVPQAGYLEAVKSLCKKYGAALIFDETITGFRLAPGGATERFGVIPDLGIYGKGLGGGMPVSCLVGTKEIMEDVENDRVFHAGTFNTNLLALQAAVTTIEVLASDNGSIYKQWEDYGVKLRCGLKDLAKKHGVNLFVKGIGQVTYTGFIDDEKMESYRTCFCIDSQKLRRWQVLLKEHGLRIISRGIWYLSTAHKQADIDAALEASDKVLAIMSKE